MKSLIELSLKGDDGNCPDDGWLTTVTGRVLCAHCHNVLPGVDVLDATIERDFEENDIDFVGVECYGPVVLSERFISLAKRPLVEQTARLGRLFIAGGALVRRCRTALAKGESVIVRGPVESKSRLCKVCGRLLYWPIGRRYVLRSEIPNLPVFLSGMRVFCTEHFFEETILPAKLARVEGIAIEVLDRPLDGLPASTDELTAAVRASGRVE